MKRWLLMGLLFVTAVVRAGVLHPELVLNQIKQVQSSEAGGDEIYLHITEFQSSGKNRQYTIPNYPLHWPSDALDQIKDLSVWKQSLQVGDSVEVLVSVIEHDAPPWNTDDLIGTMKVHIQNKAGKLHYQWNLVEDGSAGQSTKLQPKLIEPFTFKGISGTYQLTFQLLKDNSAAMPVQDKPQSES